MDRFKNILKVVAIGGGIYFGGIVGLVVVILVIAYFKSKDK